VLSRYGGGGRVPEACIGTRRLLDHQQATKKPRCEVHRGCKDTESDLYPVSRRRLEPGERRTSRRKMELAGFFFQSLHEKSASFLWDLITFGVYMRGV